ncbi:hypothetical protein OAQ12_03140 [Candidatus Marinimicrobia bacterium]|nr:hypothetical protein [Candidatus Neomarinimicrobiota bacterium]|tara:strand:- start:142 stop:666 length:525 start_codon:yes stop_codon:yes gene_type:complete
MSSKRGSKQTFMSYKAIVNIETGEEIISSEQAYEYPENVYLKYPFSKVNHIELFKLLKPTNIGYVIGLILFMKPRYNLLQEITVNKKPNPLNHSDMAEILGISKRQVSRFIKDARKVNVILKLKSNYHINPRIAQRASTFDTETLQQMIKIDHSLRKCLKNIDKQKIDFFKRAS